MARPLRPGHHGAALSKDSAIADRATGHPQGYKHIDSYSTFLEADKKPRPAGGLSQTRGIKTSSSRASPRLCVAWTAIDARRAGLRLTSSRTLPRRRRHGLYGQSLGRHDQAGVKKIQSADLAV